MKNQKEISKTAEQVDHHLYQAWVALDNLAELARVEGYFNLGKDLEVRRDRVNEVTQDIKLVIRHAEGKKK